MQTPFPFPEVIAERASSNEIQDFTVDLSIVTVADNPGNQFKIKEAC